MTKVFQLITSVHLGGAENVAFSLAEYLHSRQSGDFQCTIFELYKSGDKYALQKKGNLSSQGLKVISLFPWNNRLCFFFAPVRLCYYIIKENPDIVHSHTDLPDFVLSITLRMLRFMSIKPPRIIRTIHNTQLWPTHSRIGKYTERGFINDEIIAVSKAALGAYYDLRIKYKLSPSSWCRVIYNGCKKPNREIIPFYIRKDKINIAFCGRLEYQKGIDILLLLIKEIEQLFNGKILFHIIGSGTYYDKVISLTKENPHIFYYNTVQNIADKLYAFDFLVMPSRFEGLGLISIESSFARVPVIAARVPGLIETLPEDWPLLFHLDRMDEFLTIGRKIINNEYNLNSIKEQAYTFVSENFSMDEMMRKYISFYKTHN